MPELDFDDFLSDPRLAPLCQSLALEALDSNAKLPFCESHARARIYRAAFLPSGCGINETDPAIVCSGILKEVNRGAMRTAEMSGTVTPSFVASSADPKGILADHRLRLQLRAQIKMTRDILSQFPVALHGNG